MFNVQIHDARAVMSKFDLDTHGFAFHKDELISDELVQAIRERNKEKVEQIYYPHVEELIKKKTNANRVVIFDHTYRRRDPALGPGENPNGREQPATVVGHQHCSSSVDNRD